MKAAFQLAQDPPQHCGPVGTVGRSADEVQQHQRVGMGLSVLSGPVGQQGRLARARLAQHNQRRAVADSVPVENVKVFRPPDVDTSPAPRKGVVVGRVAVQWVGHFTRREHLVDDDRQVFQHPLAERWRVWVVVATRERALADSLLQRDQPCETLGVLLAELVAMLGGDTIQVGWVAEVKAGPVGHLRVVQHPVEDFQLGHALLAVLGQPGLELDQFVEDLLRDPAVTLAQQSKEERPAALDLG